MATSKKDYEAIAKAFNFYMTSKAAKGDRKGHAHTCYAQLWIAALANDLANYFAQDNPRFDAARFRKASGIGSPDA